MTVPAAGSLSAVMERGQNKASVAGLKIKPSLICHFKLCLMDVKIPKNVEKKKLQLQMELWVHI